MKPHVHPRKWLVRIALLVALVWGWRHLNQWGFRKELPRSATEIHEWYKTYGLLPDYMYILKARITHEEFLAYIGKFDLTLHYPERVYEDARHGPHWTIRPSLSRLAWWTPSESLDQTYVYQQGDAWIWAKHEDGWLYLYSYNQ